jgi:hypothetical protein
MVNAIIERSGGMCALFLPLRPPLSSFSPAVSLFAFISGSRGASLAFASVVEEGKRGGNTDPEEATSLAPGWRLPKGFDISWEIA